MAYQLKERAPNSLSEMKNVAVTVEENLIAKRNKARAERRITFKEEPSPLDKKIDALISNVGRLLDNVERKPTWDGQQNNTVRNPNFKRNQNPNAGRVSPDREIRPPFQENYIEASTSNDPLEDSHINLMGLKNDQHVLLSEEYQDSDDFHQMQSQTQESFNSQQAYDSSVYELNKQYKLRTRTIDVPLPINQKETKQPSRIKGKAPIEENADKSVPNTQQIAIEDITQTQPSIDQPLPHSSSKENVHSIPKSLPITEKMQVITLPNAGKKEKNAEISIEKEKSAIFNA